MLDEELEQFRERELQEYRVVYLDAHYEKVGVHGTVQDLAILKALGVSLGEARGSGSLRHAQ